MDFAEHRIATADGPRVYARDYAAEASHRLPVVCLHGLTRNSADFEAVAPRIATLGRRVIAIDARGRGKSDNDPEPARYRPDTYVGDVVRVLDTLERAARGVPRHLDGRDHDDARSDDGADAGRGRRSSTTSGPRSIPGAWRASRPMSARPSRSAPGPRWSPP